MKDSTGTNGDSIEYHIKVGTCKDCRWWDEKLEGNYGFCGNWNCIDEDAYFIRDGIAVDVSYGFDGGSCTIKVGPDFGCIHHELKESKDGN